ncbi:CsgG/HfaB family protein [Sulfurivermis fontis]|uniref:CsgG/HfaB family protein n=1 Tax=Sulfurivermis fontis TaxID=1972068 RepID=UPI000FD902BF|nr:CsgG/HfaB family protein [Sulfurivermis fontis]
MFTRLHTFFLLSLAAALLVGCSSAQVVSSSNGPTISQARAEPAMGVKKRVAVKAFEYKAAKGGYGDVGHGLSQMLTDALFNSNAFIVLERERLEEVMQEQNLGDTGRFKQETVAPKGELEGAELLIYGSVTEFEPNCRGGSLLLIGAKEACVAINIRIVDAATGRVVNATTVEGTSGSAGVGLIFTTSPLPVGLGAWAKSPMEKAMRQCIEAAVNHIVATKL